MGLGLRVVKRGQLTLVNWLTKKSTVDQKSIITNLANFVILVCTWIICKEMNENVNENDI